MSAVVIIPCGSKKTLTPQPAYRLYQGGYFKMNLRWALSVVPQSHCFILSALHGLVSLNTVLKPYNLKMGDKGSVNPLVVKEKVNTFGLSKDLIYALGGEKYLRCLHDAGVIFCAPVYKKPMGVSMGILKKNLGRLPKWVPHAF